MLNMQFMNLLQSARRCINGCPVEISKPQPMLDELESELNALPRH
jgi:hypothetical protein